VDLTSEGALMLATGDATVEVFEGEVEHLKQGENASERDSRAC
jgi:hypothetical protein